MGLPPVLKGLPVNGNELKSSNFGILYLKGESEKIDAITGIEKRKTKFLLCFKTVRVLSDIPL
jgi:hypothetical protein